MAQSSTLPESLDEVGVQMKKSQNRQSRLGISNDDRIGGPVVLDTEIDEDGKKLLHPSDTVRHQLN